MKALVWRGPEQMTVDDVPVPVVERDSVLVRSEAAGICGSEIEGYLGRMSNRVPPLIMGHEFAGVVVAVGDGVDGDWIGQKVAVNPLIPCGVCVLCRSGFTNVCPQRALLGIHRPGGFAELVNAPVKNIVAIPSNVPSQLGALAEPLANGVHAVRLGMAMVPVERAVIIGAGTIGLMVMEAAILSGISRVSVIEPFDARRVHAATFGAHATYTSTAEAKTALTQETDGLGVDLVVDAVGAEATRQAAIDLLRPVGCMIALGLRDDASSLSFHYLVRNQITIRGSYAYTMDDYTQALNWLVDGHAGIGKVPSPLPLEQGPEVFSRLAQGPSEDVKIFLSGAGDGT